MLLSVSAFALTPVKVNPAVKAAFTSDFTNAKNVSWKKTGGFYFASFDLNNVTVDAAYTDEGELVGTSRRITPQQMPLSISLAIAKDYEGYQVGKLVNELTFEGVTRYYVQVENESEQLELRCYTNGDLMVEKRSKKG